MAEKLFRILNVMHDALDFSGRGHVAPSSLSHDDFKALSNDWAALCADGQSALKGRIEAFNG